MEQASLNDFIKKLSADKKLLDNFVAAVRGGKNKVLHNVISQALFLDDSWVINIESGLYSVEQIARNPRKFIIENELIVDVAKARRTNSKTVRHLSSHSQFVQNIDKDGEVMPKKLLTSELDEDLAIYENRFICALVNRLIIFVERRYQDLVGRMDVYDQTNVCLQSKFEFGGSRFNCDLRLQVEEPPEDQKTIEANRNLFERIELIRRRLRVLQATEFIRNLNNKKPVRPPIQKTNLLSKNVDYNNCYKLWLYVSSYTYLGYSVEVKDKNLPVETDYFDDLTYITGLSLQSLLSNKLIKKAKYEAIPFSEPTVQEYELVTSYKFEPQFDSSKNQAGEESINEYYFRKMKDELVSQAKDNEFAMEKKLNVNFTKFFRSISRINDEMYNELIEESIAAEHVELGESRFSAKEAEYRAQLERVRRRKLFLKLKWEELERAQRMQERAEQKLSKMRSDLVKHKKRTHGVKVKRTTYKFSKDKE